MNIKKIPHRLINSIYMPIIVFTLSLLSRISNLGYDNINSDAFLWKQRGYEFTSAITNFRFENTLVTYHPGVSLLYNFFAANKIYSLLKKFYFNFPLTSQQEFFVNHAIQKFCVVVFTAILVTIIFILVRKLIGGFRSNIFILLLIVEPFAIALSREIHTDAIEAYTIFISLLSFYILITESTEFSLKFKLKNIAKNKYFLISSVFLALALLTKSSAIILFVFYISYFIYLIFVDYLSKTKLKAIFPKPSYKTNVFAILGSVLILAIILFSVLWPVMWVNPLKALSEYIFTGIQGIGVEEGHGHIWFGKETIDPGILFYPIVILARYSVEVIYLFIVFILYYIVNYIRDIRTSLLDPSDVYSTHYNEKTKNNTLLVYLMLFFIMYFLALTIASKKLDRYSFVLFPIILFFAVYYLKDVFNKNLIYIAFAIVILTRIYTLWAINPNYLAYYSPLTGGIESGLTLVEPKWPIGYNKVAEYFNNKKNPNLIKVAIADHDYIRLFGVFQTLNIKHDTEVDIADYLVLPSYRQERNQFYKKKYGLTNSEIEIDIAGVSVYEVYKMP